MNDRGELAFGKRNLDVWLGLQLVNEGVRASVGSGHTRRRVAAVAWFASAMKGLE